MLLEAVVRREYDGLKLNLHPRARYSINTLPTPVDKIRLLIGPEGGLSSEEIEKQDITSLRDPTRPTSAAHGNGCFNCYNSPTSSLW